MAKINISDRNFGEMYSNFDKFENKSGVYAVLDRRKNGKLYLVDVGESGEVKNRLLKHDRKKCWKDETKGEMLFAVYYTPNLKQEGRMKIEQKIRNKYDYIPCGKT